MENEIGRIENGLLTTPLSQPGLTTPLRLSDRMRFYRVPGVAIAVIHEGHLRWVRGFGVAQIGGGPLEPEALFQAGSISKPVTAFATLRLAEEGRLDLDTDVNKILTSWKLPKGVSSAGSPVTLLELLSHTAGTSVHGFGGYASGAALPTTEEVLNGLPPANSLPVRVETKPGTEWSYSGGGYVVVQQALVDATHKPFPTLMQSLVLGPLQMTSSTFQQPLPREFRSRAATPYLGDGTPVMGGPHTYPEMAPAGLWTTAGDLAKFVMGVQSAFAGASDAKLSKGMVHEMVASRLNHRGVMFAEGGSSAEPYFYHSGEDAGFLSEIVGYEHKGEGAVVLTNGARGYDLIQEILRSIAREYRWSGFTQ